MELKVYSYWPELFEASSPRS